MSSLPKGVYRHRKQLKNGKTTIYYTLRNFGPLRPLPGDENEEFGPGTPALLRAYLAAFEAPRKARTAGTFQSISDAWEKSPNSCGSPRERSLITSPPRRASMRSGAHTR